MNNKIPCGGFYLSDTLGVDENGKLGVNGGEPYKSLVTDGEGNVKWNDRLAYEDSRLVVDLASKGQAVKVANEAPSWASLDASINVWLSNGHNLTDVPEYYVDLGNGSFLAGEEAFFIAADNTEFDSFVFPEKGVYFRVAPNETYVSGIASADSDTPEITWDGNIETIKTIDSKYIPSELNELILPSSTPDSTKKFKITVNDSGAISVTEISATVS